MLLLQVYLLVCPPTDMPHSKPFYDLNVVSASLSLFSVCWALASFSKNVRLQNVHRLVLTWLGVIFQVIFRSFKNSVDREHRRSVVLSCSVVLLEEIGRALFGENVLLRCSKFYFIFLVSVALGYRFSSGNCIDHVRCFIWPLDFFSDWITLVLYVFVVNFAKKCVSW